MAEETSDILQEYNNLMKSREFGSKTWVDEFFKKNHLLAEIQALEACDWLKETGFPQYAHMYQDGQMPIDLEVAKRDHLFLDEISLRSLFCRLEILNKCFDLNICPSSEVKLRSHGKHDVSHTTDGADNDDDVEIALSNRWTYEPLSHRWSRSCEGESTTCSPTNLEFSQSEVEQMDAAVESDVESNISEVNGSGLESSSESKSFEDVADVTTDPEETLKRDKINKFREGRLSKPDSGLMDSEFMGKIDKICSSSTREEATTSGSKPGSGWRPPIQRGFSENSGVQLFENLDEYYEPDYRDIFDSLADLSKSLICEDDDENSRMKRQASNDYCGAMMLTSSAKKETEAGFNQSAIVIRRKQTNRGILAKMGHSFEQSTTSSLSSSTLSTPSSHSSLSMASYTLHGNLQDPSNQSHFKPTAHHQLHQLQQHLHHQQQQQQQQQQQHHHQNLAVTLSTRSENSYLTSRFIDANILQTKPVTKKLLSKVRGKERKAFIDEISNDLDELRERTGKPPTMYASRDSFSPSECNLASRYCFPKTSRHRQPPPPSPLLTRAADKIRGAFNFLRKIDGPGSVRRSLKKKDKLRNVENAQKDFVGGLLKNDISHPGQGQLSADLESKVESLKCFDVERSQKTKLQQLESPESCPQIKLSGKDPLAEVEIPLEDDDTLRPKKHQGRKMSTYDNVFSSHDFDKILNDLYSNIFLLDQSLVCETDEESKSQTGSTNTPSSSSESQEPLALSPDARPSSNLFHEILDETETDTLKSRGRSSAEAFKRDVDKHEDAEDSDEDGDDNDDRKRWRYPDVGERERRDSGVGSSLTRRPSNRRTVRWQSFLKDRSEYSISDLSKLSAQQMAILERYCLLRITSILEKYGSISRKSWKNLMNRKQKAVCLSDYPQRAVFGVPLEVLRIRYGQALPKCVLLAMKKLRRSIEDCDGIFRKAGAKVRVQALKDAIVSDPESIDYEESSVHDLADILKAFLKELPDCLFTGRFSKILTNIFKNVPKDLHMESVQACLVLMPNDHRDCLHTFMLFTHYLAKHSHITQMNASNLALCLSPSFFHLESASSSTPNSRKQQSAYKKCIDEQKFVHQCLTFVIENAPFLFTNFQGFFDSCHISPSSNLANSGYLMLRENMDQQYNANLCSARLKYLFQFVMKEAKSSSRGWSVANVISSSALISPSSTLPLLSMLSTIPHMSVEVSYKKAGDSSYPLRLWRCSMLVEAPPVEVLTRILWDRHLWDFDLLKWRWVEKIDNNTEVFQYVLNSMAPHPPRMYTDLRSWKVNLTTGSCTLVCQSVEYPKTHAGFSVPAEVQASHYHIEPCGSGRCRLTLISRIDFKGHSLSWYNHTYDHMVASQLLRISLTLANNFISSNLPETKV